MLLDLETYFTKFIFVLENKPDSSSKNPCSFITHCIPYPGTVTVVVFPKEIVYRARLHAVLRDI